MSEWNGPTMWAPEKSWRRIERRNARLTRRMERWLRRHTYGPNLWTTWKEHDAH